MVEAKKISAEDISGINIDVLLICPFCEILGEHSSSKVPADRKVSVAASNISADRANDSDEITDLDYVPQPPSGSEDDDYDSDDVSEESCKLVSSSSDED